MKLRIGASLQNGKYQLNQVLGRESLGATYLATQTLLQQSVVIKTIDPSLQVMQSFPQLKTRFIEETRLLARSQHPSIVRVLDFFQEDGLPFLVMEYIPGQTLHDRISTFNAPHLTEAEAIHYLRQVASALSVAHRNGLIHRNIRPETIVRRQGTNLGVLVGFGFAHDLAPPVEKSPFLPLDANWSQDNRFAIDLYSLAATLYFILTGQFPNGSPSLEHHSWSPATKQAIFRGLTRDPQWQLQTADEWLRLLPNTTLPLMATNPTSNGANSAANNIVQSTPTTGNSTSSQNGRGRSIEPEVTLASFPVQNGRSAAPPTKAPTAPPAPTLTALPTTAVEATPASAVLVSPTPRLPKSLVLTMVTAGAIGVGFGLALRISATKAPGTTLLQPVQPFPEKEWKGTLNPNDKDAADLPLESSSANSNKTPLKPVTPEVDRSIYTPPKIETPSPEPIRPRRHPLTEEIVPTNPVKPKPSVEPSEPEIEPTEPLPETSTTPEPVVPPATAPAPVAPAPLKPSSREVTPTPPTTP
ncbi:protein kinase [Cyanobacteria bacterium FACHB-DQ100]|nr:protein kinase [Cyanobacteria bacterium FACHB-DQ100]